MRSCISKRAKRWDIFLRSAIRGVAILLFCLILLALVSSTYSSNEANKNGAGLYPSKMGRPDLYSQICLIDYHDGIERMILTTGGLWEQFWEEDGFRKVAWIVPVPAPIEDISIKPTRVFPLFNGANLEESADLLASTIYGFSCMHFYPAIYQMTQPVYFSLASSLENEFESKEQNQTDFLCTALLQAQSTEEIRGFLLEQGVEVEEERLSYLDDYFTGEYSFAIAWLPSKEASFYTGCDINDNMIEESGVCISFPTKEAYYPLRASGLYGEYPYILLIYSIGYHTPEFASISEGDVEVGYFRQDDFRYPEELSVFMNNDAGEAVMCSRSP